MYERGSFTWPRFELVTVSGEGLPSPWNEQYAALELPDEYSICGCRPAALKIFTVVEGWDLIQLGEFGNGPLCLDPADGRLFDFLIPDPETGVVWHGPRLVNSSLKQYVSTVEQATARFPYDDGAEDADLDEIAEQLREELSPIDPAAWNLNCYWDGFYLNVAFGDFHSRLFRR